MAKVEEYAQWIIDNADKKGTKEFNIVAQAYQEAKGIPVEPTAFEKELAGTKADTGFTGAFKAGKERLKGDVAALAGRTGIMDTEAAEKYKTEKERLAEKMFTPTKESFAEAPFTKFKELLGGSLPYTAAPLAVGIGAAALPAVGVAAPIATGVGLVGAGLASLGQFTGSNLSRQMQENPQMRLADTSLSSAAAAAAPQAALDVVSLRMIPGIGKIFGAAGKEITPKLAQQIAEQGILKTTGAYGAGALRTATIEGTTEAGQQFLERLQAGLNLTDQQARDEYFDSFIGGAVLGGTLGVPGTYLERGQIVRKGAEMEKEEQQKAIQDRQKAQREAYLAEQAQLKQTSQNLGVPTTLALPAPETKLEPIEEQADPLKDPLGRFKSTDLSAKEVAEVNKRRLEMGKPRIGRTFSIEDLADVFKPEESTAAEGVLGRLIASRTNFTGEDIPAQTVELAAQQRGLDTRTQGFRDFLARVTGSEDLNTMSPPQRFAVAQAIRNLKAGEETQILEAGISNAKHYTPDQYNDTLKGLSKEFKEMGNQENGRSSVLKLIEKYSGLKQERDQQRILDEAVKNGDLERNVKASSTGSTIETFKPATAMTPLPGGMDIRKETFKQGETPSAYEVRAGNRVISTIETAEEAEKNAAIYEQNRQSEIVKIEKTIKRLESEMAKRDAELVNDQALGYDQGNPFFIKSANYYGQNQVTQQTIKNLREEQQTFSEPVRIDPIGVKPVAKDSFTFYEKDQPQVKFDSEEQAEAYGISRLDDKTLQQIIDSAGAQKQTGRVKRYADLAQKELNDRQSIETERGIAITTKKGTKGSKERLEKLGIYSKEAHDNLEKLRQTLLPALKRFGLEKVALRVLNSIEDGTADGYYIKQVMAIALDSKNPMGTLRHESIHALKELGAFTAQEWKVLENKAKSEWVQKYIKDAKLYDAYKARYLEENGSLTGFEPYIQEEAIAEAFKHFKVGSLPPGMIGNIWVRLNKMFEALRNAFNKLGFQTTDDIFTRIEEGKKQPAKEAVSEEAKLAKRPLNTKEDIIADGAQRYANALIKNNAVMPDGYGGYDILGPSTMGGRADAALTRIIDGIETRLKAVGVSTTRDERGNTELENAIYREVIPQGRKLAIEQEGKKEPKFALRETDQFSKDAVETNNWKATPIAKRMAEDYAAENDITPYLSEGQISIPVEPVKYSIKPPSDDPTKNDPTTGLPLNKNGSVTLYYPTTAAEVRRINNEKKITPSNPNISAIYLTNESSGWKSFGVEPIPFVGMVQYSRISDDYQVTDGSVVRVEIDPSLLQITEEYEDGRKEFYVPVKEGEYFNKKMRMWAMYAERNKAIPLATKYSDLGNAFERSLNAFKQLNEAEKKARTKEVKDLLKRDHNIGKLLGENGKLEKTRVGDYGITYDDKSVASLGLGLASAQKLNDKTSTCPVSAICEGLCLGDTAGNNKMYGGMASGKVAEDIEKTSFRAGPRLSQYLKTEAMIVHPEEFALLLDKEIKAFKRWADKNDYLPAIRLNVTSDIPPKYFKPIIDANPEVIFYDYTKLDSSTVADNHHLTYSSTGVSQTVDNEKIVNKEQNWDRMKRLLDKGSNVAMAFTSKSDMPSVIVDEASGKEYQVWNGDNYDARFLDPKREDGVGMIVGLTNKDSTVKAAVAAKETKGFFVDYDKARDGERVVIQDQSKFAGSKVIPITKIAEEPKKLSIRAPETEEFKQWFGDSKVVDEDGNPMVVYHATKNNFFAFDPKKLTKNTKHPTAKLGFFAAVNPESTDDFVTVPYGIGKGTYEAGANIMPLYASIKNPVTIPSGQFVLQSMALQNMKKKDADKFINDFIQSLRDEGHDGILITADKTGRGLAGGKEFSSDNWVALDPNQFKSAFNEKPTESADIRYSLRAPDTKEFKEFFKDSKVVDEDGNPLLVYRGQRRDAGAESTDLATRATPSFTDNKYVASVYSYAKSKGKYTEGSNVAPSYLKMVNPIDLREFGNEPKPLIDLLEASGITGLEESPDVALNILKDLDDLQEKTGFESSSYSGDYDYVSEAFDKLNNAINKNLDIDTLGSLAFDILEDLRVDAYALADSPTVVEYVKEYNPRADGFIVRDVLSYSGMEMVGKENLKTLGQDGGYDAYRPFEQNQIKSAFNQKPTESKDVRYSLRAPETVEFKRFFNGSKVVDENGKPLPVYHATTNFDGNEFKPMPKVNRSGNPDGYYFTHDIEDANAYAGVKEGAEIIPAFLSIKNPYPYGQKTVHNQAMIDQFEKEMSKEFDLDRLGESWYKEKLNVFKQGRFPNISFPTDAMTRVIQAGGYDGMKDGRDFVAFKPNQIKSAFNQTPTESPDIRYALRSQLSDRLNERIGSTTTRRKQAGFVERLMDAISPTAMTQLRQSLINKYESIEILSRLRGEKMGGDQLLAENSAIAAALQSDRAAGVAASSFKDGIPVFDKGYTYVSNMDGKVKGLIPILEPLMKYNDPYIFQTFQYYAGTRRGRRLDAEGREKTFTKEDIAYGKELEAQFPEFATVFDEYQKYNSGLVKYMMDTGVISPQEAKAWTENWDYIPFYRQLDGEKTAGPKVFSSIAGVAKPKKLKGSEAPLDDFMETIVRNARAAIEAGMKNEAARRVIRDVVDFGLGERLPSSQSGSDVVTVKEKGMTVYYRVADPLLVESLKGLNLPQLPFMDFLSAPANLLRNFVTKDPGFILANLGRDSMQAWITSGTDMKPLVDSFKQFGKELANQSPEANALARSGLTGYDFAGDVKSTSKQVEKELRKRSGTRTVGEKSLLPITAFWDMLEKGSHASDMATRAEVYKRTLERTGSEAEAFYQAMEVLNFSRKGNSALIRIVSAMIPFFNARVQGLDVLYRTGFGKTAMQNKDTIQKAFMFRSMILLGTSVMYWAMVSDDEDYKKLSKEERDNYWIIPAIQVGDKPFRFPIPFELGVLFKVLPERALEYSFGTDTGKDLRESLLRNAMSTLSFNPIPQAALPLVENATNHSFFTGEPIIGRGVEGLAPQFQFGSGTSELAKKLGRELEYSPQKIDNLIRGYTGTMGSYAMMLIDSALTQEGDPVKATKRMEQLPVIKRFFAGDMGTVSAYYDLKQEVDTVVQTVNTLQRTGNGEDLKTYLEENKKLYALKGYVGTLDKTMKQLNQAAKMINASKTMTADEKREAIDKIHEAQLRLTSRVRILRKDYE
jgi:hypothetical protein